MQCLRAFLKFCSFSGPQFIAFRLVLQTIPNQHHHHQPTRSISSRRSLFAKWNKLLEKFSSQSALANIFYRHMMQTFIWNVCQSESHNAAHSRGSGNHRARLHHRKSVKAAFIITFSASRSSKMSFRGNPKTVRIYYSTVWCGWGAREGAMRLLPSFDKLKPQRGRTNELCSWGAVN